MSGMNKVLWGAAVVALFSAGGLRAQDEDATIGSVSVDVASAYVFRGVTLNDGPVVQPSIEIEALPGLTLGVWANFDLDDYGGTLEKNEFSEVDFTASYALPIEGVDLTLGYAVYEYPNSDADMDHEVSLSLALPLPLSPSLAVYYGVDGAIRKTFYVEAGIGHDLALTEEVGLNLGATVGYVSPDEGDSGFSSYTLSASLSYKYLSVGVTYIGQIDDAVLSDDVYDVDVVATVSLSIPF